MNDHSCSTGKIVYPNRGTARHKLARIRRAGRMQNNTLEAYWCHRCGFWHLGNRPPNAHERRKILRKARH